MIIGKQEKALFVLSLDCEMLWGSHYSGGLNRYPYLIHGFDGFYQNLLQLLDRFSICATFAMVGAIALSREEFKKKVRDLPASLYRHWLEEILHLSEGSPSYWHDPSLIEKILSTNTKHELASHSFTHLRFTSTSCNERAAAFELALSHEILSRASQREIKTFVFPENRIAHLQEFKKSPYVIYRSCDPHWYHEVPFKRASHFLDQLLPIAPHSVVISQDQWGNLCLPGSMVFLAYDGVRKLIPDEIRFIKMRRGIDQAIQKQKIFHLWFHPWNLGSSGRMLRLLEKILAYVRDKRSAGLLETVTMGDLL